MLKKKLLAPVVLGIPFPYPLLNLYRPDQTSQTGQDGLPAASGPETGTTLFLQCSGMVKHDGRYFGHKFIFTRLNGTANIVVILAVPSATDGIAI